MDRLACVNVAALPLQILLRLHPAWSALPVAVVEDDRPQALVLWLNGRARRAGIRAGQRYATALALARDLHAGTVSRAQIDDSVRTLADRLRQYSPHVEPAADTPGVFWLDASGLERLYPSFPDWVEAIRAALTDAGMTATVAVGFSRFGTYALATSRREMVVCADAADERAQVHRVPLARLDFDPAVRDRLLALGISTVGAFLRLPGDGIRARFGAATDALYQLAAGQRWAPLVPVPAEERHERTVEFDAPDSNVERLVFVIKRLLDALVPALAHQGEAVVALVMQMKLDDRATRVERVSPAAPTVDVAQLLTLVRLRLDTLRLSAGVVTLGVTADTCPATPDQRRLFAGHTRRDAGAADQAFARIRAECGDDSVVRARLCDAHLPAARFAWEPLAHAPIRSAARVVATRPRVRRIYGTPLPLAPGFGLQAPGARSPEPGAMAGPYILSGGWWGNVDVHRAYYFAHTASGDLWWLYYDRRRQRFYLQGQVE